VSASGSADGADARTADRLFGRLRALADEAHVRVAVHPVAAGPVEALTRVASEERADLIVVGSTAAHGARRLSSVPQEVMDTAACAVMVV